MRALEPGLLMPRSRSAWRMRCRHATEAGRPGLSRGRIPKRLSMHGDSRTRADFAKRAKRPVDASTLYMKHCRLI